MVSESLGHCQCLPQSDPLGFMCTGYPSVVESVMQMLAALLVEGEPTDCLVGVPQELIERGAVIAARSHGKSDKAAVLGRHITDVVADVGFQDGGEDL